MKMKKVFAVLASSVLVAGSLASMAACGGSKANWVSLDISKYAAEMPAAATEKTPAITTATKLPITVSEFSGSVNGVTIQTVTTSGSNGNTTYRIYDIENEDYWSTEYYSLRPTLRSYSDFTYAVIPYSASGSSRNRQYFVTSSLGQLFKRATYSESLYSPAMNINVSADYGTVNGNFAKIITFSATNIDDDESATVYAYVLGTYDDEGEISYKKVTSNDFADYNDDEEETEKLGVGDKIELYEKNEIYESTKKKPVKDGTENYTYTYDGREYTFYDGKERKGSVEADKDVAFVGNYMYYNEYTYLPDTSTEGFNSFNELHKTNVALFRYDFVHNSTTEIKTEYVVKTSDIKALYNYEDGAYDAAVCTALKTTNGTVYSGDNRAKVTLVTDAQLNPAYDITAYGSTPSGLVKADDDRFILSIGGTVYSVDKDLKPLSKLSSTPLMLGDELCVSFADGENIGFATLDGTVKIAAKYYFENSPEFIGGFAHCYLNEKSDTATDDEDEPVEGFLKDNGTFIKLSSRVDSADDLTIYDSGVYEVRKSVTSSKTTCTYYNYAGAKVKEFTIDVSLSATTAYSNVLYSDGFILATTAKGETEVYKLKSASDN